MTFASFGPVPMDSIYHVLYIPVKEYINQKILSLVRLIKDRRGVMLFALRKMGNYAHITLELTRENIYFL